MLVSRGAASTCVSAELLVPHQSSEPVLCSQVSFCSQELQAYWKGVGGRVGYRAFHKKNLLLAENRGAGLAPQASGLLGLRLTGSC